MPSNINPLNPVTGSPTTASVRANFQAAHDEITALQATPPGSGIGSITFAAPLTGGTITASGQTVGLGNVPPANLGGGTGASATTYWRGDGTWATPGTVQNGTGPQIAQYAAGTSAVVAGVTVSGDAAIAAGGALTIQPAAVTYTKMQAASAAQRLIGSAVGATALGEITLGTNLSMAGSTLNAAGGAAADTVTRAIAIPTTAINQATATALGIGFNEIITVPPGTCAALPAGTVGGICKVRNSGANPLTLYPANGSNAIINALAANAPITVPTDTTAYFEAVAVTQWYTVP